MWKTTAATLLAVALLSAHAAAQDARAVIAEASRTMGAGDLRSIAFSGAAGQGNIGQSRIISFGLATTPIRNYTRTIDFAQPASLALGDTLPPVDAGASASQPGLFTQSITPATPEWAQQLEIWATPWGFLKGAAATTATVKSRKIDGVAYKVVTWSPARKAPSGQPYSVAGYIGPQGLIDRVETWVEHPIFGDMHVEFFYTEYKDFGGVKVPTRITQSQTGMQMFVVSIREARPNPPNLAQLLTPPVLPAAGRGGASPAVPVAAPTVASEKLADGVYRLTGGYVALAVELDEFVVVLEGGQSEERGLAILAETKRLLPNKPIRYVVNSHPHFDHAGGLPPFAAEGITIITDDNNKYFLTQALGSPRTLAGDVLARSRRKPKVEGVVDKLVLGVRGGRTIELHHVKNFEHSEGMLLALLPKEKILFTADFNIPGPGQPASPSLSVLVQNIERLQLDFDRHVTVHAPNPDRPITKADLLALAKRAN
jgi:glyoxylase-like metal-dependent hydrolase (beta-lactamase superfamily II)